MLPDAIIHTRKSDQSHASGKKSGPVSSSRSDSLPAENRSAPRQAVPQQSNGVAAASFRSSQLLPASRITAQTIVPGTGSAIRTPGTGPAF